MVIQSQSPTITSWSLNRFRTAVLCGYKYYTDACYSVYDSNGNSVCVLLFLPCFANVKTKYPNQGDETLVCLVFVSLQKWNWSCQLKWADVLAAIRDVNIKFSHSVSILSTQMRTNWHCGPSIFTISLGVITKIDPTPKQQEKSENVWHSFRFID